jgi:rod shape-determining protein MreC
MRSLINFLKRFGNILLFLVLELLAFYLLAAKPNHHNIKLTKAINGTNAAVNKRLKRAADYFSLKEVNRQLVTENAELKNKLQRVYSDTETKTFSVTDSIYRQQYIYIQAAVVNNSVNKQKNFITLNRGSLSGVEEDMAVSSPGGIVGIIVEVGRHYSIAMSVLNLEFRLSARLRKNSYFGSLTWDGVDVNSLVLNEIPSHVNVSVGDTVETTGFSAVFPEGIMIGTVSEVNGERGDFYEIRVKPSAKFRKLSNVYVIVNLDKEDQLQLESEIGGTI